MAVVKGDADKAEGEAEDRGFIVSGDEVEAALRVELSAQLRWEAAKGDAASGEEEFGNEVVFIPVRVNEMAKGRERAVWVFESEEEKLVIHGDSGHSVEGVEAAIGDKETLAGNGIAVHKCNTGIVFVEEGAGLNDGVDIAFFQEIEESGGVELMISAVIGIVGDKGIGVIICGDVEVGTVAGKEMQAEFGFTEGKMRIEALKQGREEIIIELGTLADEGGGGRSGQQRAFGIADVEEAMDFTLDCAFLHGHHEQDKILEGKAAVAGKVPTGAVDKTVQILFHSIDGTEE